MEQLVDILIHTLFTSLLNWHRRVAHAHSVTFENMAGGGGGERGGGCSRVKWLTDLEKTVIVSNFEKRGWVKGSFEGE